MVVQYVQGYEIVDLAMCIGCCYSCNRARMSHTRKDYSFNVAGTIVKEALACKELGRLQIKQEVRLSSAVLQKAK